MFVFNEDQLSNRTGSTSTVKETRKLDPNGYENMIRMLTDRHLCYNYSRRYSKRINFAVANNLLTKIRKATLNMFFRAKTKRVKD